MALLKKCDDLLARLEGVLLILVLVLMVTLSFGQVVARNLFGQGWVWADLLVRQLVLWVGFLGASLAVRERKHLAIDFLPNLVSPTARRWVRGLAHLAAGIISLFLARASWSFLQFEREGGSTLFGDIPNWWFQTILPYSLAVIGVRFLFRSLQDFRGQTGEGP